MELHPVSPQSYAALLPLVAEAPATLDARARLLIGRGNTIVSADDATAPAAAAIEWEADAVERIATVVGAWEAAALGAYVRARARPTTLLAPDALAACLPAIRPDLVRRPYITYRAPAEAGTSFRALPPGGVRRLRPADAHALAAFPEALWGAYGTAATALRDGIAYARYLRAEIVAIACVGARTERWARISAFTIERARRNGFARECATRLLGALMTEWHVAPLLTCPADDSAAGGFARALGLTEAREWMTYALP